MTHGQTRLSTGKYRGSLSSKKGHVRVSFGAPNFITGSEESSHTTATGMAGAKPRRGAPAEGDSHLSAAGNRQGMGPACSGLSGEGEEERGKSHEDAVRRAVFHSE